MIGFLASRFIKDYQNTSDAAVRRAYGVLCGAVGIVINLLLFALKLFAGTLAGSVAVTAATGGSSISRVSSSRSSSC